MVEKSALWPENRGSFCAPEIALAAMARRRQMRKTAFKLEHKTQQMRNKNVLCICRVLMHINIIAPSNELMLMRLWTPLLRIRSTQWTRFCLQALKVNCSYALKALLLIYISTCSLRTNRLELNFVEEQLIIIKIRRYILFQWKVFKLVSHAVKVAKGKRLFSASEEAIAIKEMH